jgi:hypothetical protein
MRSGLRPYQLAPLNRGCVQKIVVQFKQDGEWIDKTSKKLYLTAKTQPWDEDADDSDATFKVIGTIPDSSEPGRVVFSLTEQQTYQDPTIPYFCDIVETDSDGTSNANRVFIGSFYIIGGANNQQAGGVTV